MDEADPRTITGSSLFAIVSAYFELICQCWKTKSVFASKDTFIALHQCSENVHHYFHIIKQKVT